MTKLNRRSFFSWVGGLLGLAAMPAGAGSILSPGDVLPRKLTARFPGDVLRGTVQLNFDVIACRGKGDADWEVQAMGAIEAIRGDRKMFSIAGQILFPYYSVSGYPTRRVCAVLYDPSDPQIEFGAFDHAPEFKATTTRDGWKFEPVVKVRAV